jgi:hypothetical protein
MKSPNVDALLSEVGLVCYAASFASRGVHTHFRGAAAGWDATGRFLSCEPFLTPIVSLNGIGWVIGGAQSGASAALLVLQVILRSCWSSGVDARAIPRDASKRLILPPRAAALDGRLWREFSGLWCGGPQCNRTYWSSRETTLPFRM